MENKQLTLGSLFDGSGGFPLGGILSGITPVWSSEIEPFPIRVTTKRLPQLKHYGDVSVLNGAELEPVDIITFGSPCQDMSIAGKREGLDGSRSGLFYEAIRIVKEMRCKTNGQYPRFIVWENVPGAFSSNGGEDFKAVLEAVCSVKGSEVSIARPEKWADAGEILADNFSVAWRVLDAQYWGVPQRRKRIYLVADFDDQCAGKILFESEGLSGYSAQGFRSWQDFACNAGKSAQAASLCLNDQGGQRMDITEDVTATLRAEAHHPPVVMESAGFCTEHSAKARGIGFEEEKSPTLRAGVVPAAMMFENHSQDTRYTGPLDVAQTVSANYGMGGNNQPFVVETPKTLKIRSGCEGGGKGALVQDNLSATLATNNDQTLFVPQPCAWDGGQVSGTLTMHNACGSQRMPDKENFNCVLTPKQKVYGICSKESNAMKSDNPKSGFYEADTSRTLDCNGGNPSANQGGIAVVAVQGSMIGRDDRNGPQGDGINEDVSFTLNTVDRHAVAYGIDRATYNMGQNAQFNISVQEEVEPTLVAKGPGAVAHPTYCMTTGSYTEVVDEKTPTLMARDYKDPPVVNDTNNELQYIVRRLTPTECARLQGFPDWWCSDLETENPTDEEMAFWTEVFETHRNVVTHAAKPKSEKQIRKWLADPYSDSAVYKLYGNGVALPNVFFVLADIVYYAQNCGDKKPENSTEKTL